MTVFTFLRLLTLYLSSAGYDFDHRLMADAVIQCLRTGKCLRITLTDEEPHGGEGVVLGVAVPERRG